MKIRGYVVATVAGALLAGAAVWELKPAPAPGPAKVETDTLWLEKQRPDLVKPSLGQKLTTTRVRGQTTIADAPSAPARLALRSYCLPLLQPPAADSVSSKENPPPALPDFSGRRAGSRLELYSTLNSERRWQWTGTARGRVTWESSGDSVLVRGDRLWVRLVRGGIRCSPKIGATGLVGGLLDRDKPLRGAAISAGVAALGCLF